MGTPADRQFRDRVFLRPLSIRFRDRSEPGPPEIGGPLAAPVAGVSGTPEPDAWDAEGQPVQPLPADLSYPGGRLAGGHHPKVPEPRRSGPQRLMTGPGRVALGRAWQLGDSAGVLARRHPLEIAAVLLLGVGGAIFPPVWLLGVPLAMMSRVWDLRDKWIGVAGPVLAVIFGTVATLIMGGQQEPMIKYATEAWVWAGRIERVAAAVGAAYLLWRIFRGPRELKQPPWNLPHRLG